MPEWNNDKTAKRAVIDQLNDYIVRYNGNKQAGLSLKTTANLNIRDARHILYAFETLEGLVSDKDREVSANGR